MISTSTSPSLGPSRSSSTISSGCLGAKATAARVFMESLPVLAASALPREKASANARFKRESMQANHWLEGRHALVTGGGTGIGAATATHLHAAGAKISLLGRRREPLERTAAIVSGAAIPCDVTDRAAIDAAFAKARNANGPISMLIVNAGIGDSAPFARTSRETWDRIIATNLTSAFDCVAAALPDLAADEDSRIVFVASVAGLRGAAYAAPYVASKHGMVGLMRSLALEY